MIALCRYGAGSLSACRAAPGEARTEALQACGRTAHPGACVRREQGSCRPPWHTPARWTQCLRARACRRGWVMSWMAGGPLPTGEGSIHAICSLTAALSRGRGCLHCLRIARAPVLWDPLARGGGGGGRATATGGQPQERFQLVQTLNAPNQATARAWAVSTHSCSQAPGRAGKQHHP